MAEKTRMDHVIEQAETSRLDEIRSAIDTKVLTSLVREALGSPGVEVDAWECEEVKGGIGESQVCRVSGSAVEQRSRMTWVLFLKILSRSTDTVLLTGDDWKREALAYEAGVCGFAGHDPG